MKRLLSLVIVALLLLSGTAALAEAPTNTPTATTPAETALANATISATGVARTTLAADIAVLTLQVQASGESVTQAQASAEALLDGLRQTLVAQGIADEDIQTAYYAIQTVYSYQYSKLGEQELPSGYTVSANIEARVRDISRVGQVIDAAILGGAQSTYELAFESSRYAQAYADALTVACSDAANKAALLATAAGAELGTLNSITELPPTHTPTQETADIATVAAGDHLLSIVATVEVVYNTKP